MIKLLLGNPWAWVAAALLAAGIFGSGYGCHAVRFAKEMGEKDAAIKTSEALLAEIRSQREDFIKQRDNAQAAAAKVPAVVTQWMRDTNTAPIAPGCEAAIQFQRARAPILSAHRMQVIP